MGSFEAYSAFLGFANSQTLFRRFNTMIDRIAYQVAERRLKTLQDIAVYLRGTPNDLKADVLPQPPFNIMHHTRQTLYPVLKGTHTAGDRFAIEAIGQVF